MTHTRKTEGIILRRKNFSEADRIVTVYSKDFGKIHVIAKGVRKVTSRRSACLELFNHSSFVLVRGRSLDIIGEVSVVNIFPFLRKNLLKATLAYYFCELVDRLTPDEQENQQVFTLLQECLSKISSVQPKALVREFEERLLTELGFGIPEDIKKKPGSLHQYIESIIERRINSPDIVT